MADTIKCTCAACGAKYRLPLEAQGRTARCKRCGERFEVPRQETLEDSILSWLSAPSDDEEETAAPQPRVISMPASEEPADPEAAARRRGTPIRMKGNTPKSESA